MKTIIKIISYINFLEKERINSMIYTGTNFN
jgi:hypothetical protein